MMTREYMGDFDDGCVVVSDANGMVMIEPRHSYDEGLLCFTDEQIPALIEWLTERQKKMGAGTPPLMRAAAILAHDMNEPPEECEHGFPPRECPNDACPDRAVEWAWYVGRFGIEPFNLTEVGK